MIGGSECGMKNAWTMSKLVHQLNRNAQQLHDLNAVELYQKDKNYFTTLTLVTNEQTLLQTVLLLHKIQVPSSHPIVSEEDLLDCAKERTTIRTTKNRDFPSKLHRSKRERKKTLWTCPDVKLKLHPTTIDSHAKQ